MNAILTKAQQNHILSDPVLRVMRAVAAAGGEARVVGGAVRDTLVGRVVGDIDMAATLPPEALMDALRRDGIKTVPTGLAHGTVTAVIDGVGYEITTLRRDIETDGRHAHVAFTDDWQSDAARRDFTMNALYMDAAGNVYDYFGGAADAAAGHVRFIGDAATRLREDYLRVLRFFRFYAWFGRGQVDTNALAACHEAAPCVGQLSAERLARETLKLLAAPKPLAAWKWMADCGVVAVYLPQAIDEMRLNALLEVETHWGGAANPLLRLAALLPEDDSVAASVAARLKLSHREKDRLCVYALLPSYLRGNLTSVPLRRILYKYGAEDCGQALLLLDGDLGVAFEVLKAWKSPRFPVKGEDIMRLGVPAGPKVGEVLRKLEMWWASTDYRADRAQCLAQAVYYGKIP